MNAIKPNDIIKTTITRIGVEGDGVGTYDHLHVIVPKTAPGDKISCIVKYITKDRIHANLLEIIEPSLSRVPAPCIYYSSCGGCDLQHLTAEMYKNYKLELLTNALQNNNIPLPSFIPWFSVGKRERRRAFVRFAKNPSSNQNIEESSIGFYAHQSHDVIDIKQCLILEEHLESLLAPLKELSMQLGINIEGWMITHTDTGIDLALHSDEKKIKDEGAIFKALAGFMKVNEIARISWKRGNKIFPVSTKIKPALMICGREIILPQEYFLQASKAGQEAILNAVIPHIGENAKLLDLFSGLGIYSFAFADKADRICAYEIAPDMVESMETNIRKHGLQDKISAYLRDVESFPLAPDELAKFDTAIINPPRTGALKQVSVLAKARINKIIIVSCNSTTFARDAKILHENGYKLDALYAIDQFYYSHHLEQIGVFVR